jgi:membrane fusion protein (multidrug efflux system)
MANDPASEIEAFRDWHRMSDRSNSILHLAVLVASALLAAACGDQAARAEGPVPGAPEVSVRKLKAGPVALSYAYPGRAVPFREVEVHARVAGILKQRVYTEGSEVQAGDVLFRIDPVPFEIEVAQAQARLQQVKLRLAQAESDSARVTQLFIDKSGSAQARDNSVFAVEIAKAGVVAAEQALKTASMNLGYTTVTAPIDGVTSLKLKSEGGLVDAAGPSSLLARITQVDPIYVSFSFSDRDLTQIQGMLASGKAKASEGGRWTVRVTSDDDQTIEEQGTIDFIDSNVDLQTGTIQARAVISNKNGRLRPGQFLQVGVTGISLPEALVVPQVAVMQGPQGPFVYVVDANSKALVRPITLGREVDDGWVIAGGVNAGDRIITNGMIKVMPGAAVSVASPDQLDFSRLEIRK